MGWQAKHPSQSHISLERIERLYHSLLDAGGLNGSRFPSYGTVTRQQIGQFLITKIGLTSSNTRMNNSYWCIECHHCDAPMPLLRYRAVNQYPRWPAGKTLSCKRCGLSVPLDPCEVYLREFGERILPRDLELFAPIEKLDVTE